MTRKLDFSLLEEPPEELHARQAAPYASAAPRWRSREPREVIQMSIRLPVETYERFRALCEHERRTNGDMLRVLLEGYLDRLSSSSSKQKGKH